MSNSTALSLSLTYELPSGAAAPISDLPIILNSLNKFPPDMSSSGVFSAAMLRLIPSPLGHFSRICSQVSGSPQSLHLGLSITPNLFIKWAVFPRRPQLRPAVCRPFFGPQRLRLLSFLIQQYHLTGLQKSKHYSQNLNDYNSF